MTINDHDINFDLNIKEYNFAPAKITTTSEWPLCIWQLYLEYALYNYIVLYVSCLVGDVEKEVYRKGRPDMPETNMK